MVQDTEKRLDELFDKLASSQISRPLLARLMHLSNALTQRAHPAAMQITLQLMTDFMTTEGKWVVGLKRLAEMYART
jgi:hypothetical protein